MTRGRQLIIYTDLDGTLLDEKTYSFAAACPALALIRSEQIPLVFCSSKTRAEIEPIQQEMRLRHPFIIENGGAIYLPCDYFSFVIERADTVEDWLRLELGTPYEQLVRALAEIKRQVGGSLVGFSDLTAEEMAADCGLSLEEARRAKAREYDEPFKLLTESPEVVAAVESAIKQLGLYVTQGSRYFHLMGENDKGHAVRLLSNLFQKQCGAVFTVGIGDSFNDWPLLASVDLPVLVRRPGGEPDRAVVARLPGIRVTDGIGPVGWNEAMLELILAGLAGEMTIG